jgi:hypothetical protein
MYSDGATNSEFTVISGINIDGNHILSDGIYRKGCKIIRSSSVTNCTVSGIHLAGWVNSTIIEETAMVLNYNGLLMDGTANTAVNISKCNIRQNTNHGICITQGSGWSFDHCVIESNSGRGLYLYTDTGVGAGQGTFYVCWFENNGLTGNVAQLYFGGVDTPADVNYVTFTSCTFDALSNTSHKDVDINKGSFIHFLTCKFGASYHVADTINIGDASYTYIYNSGRGASDGNIQNNVTDNGHYTQITNNPITMIDGLWTPSLGGNATYVSSTGQWHRIGNQVTASFDIHVNVLGTGSATTLSGLPFTVSPNDTLHPVQPQGSVLFYGLPISITYINCTAVFNTKNITFNTVGTPASSMTITQSVFANSAILQGTITYTTDELPLQ